MDWTGRTIQNNCQSINLHRRQSQQQQKKTNTLDYSLPCTTHFKTIVYFLTKKENKTTRTPTPITIFLHATPKDEFHGVV